MPDNNDLVYFENGDIRINESRFIDLLQERGFLRAIDDLKDSLLLETYRNSKHSAEAARKLKMNRTTLIYYLYQMGVKPCEKKLLKNTQNQQIS